MTTMTRRPTRPAVNNDWQTQGACRPSETGMFFAEGQSASAKAQIEQAKSVCRDCPVRQACLGWALTTGQGEGVWGGRSAAERAELLAQRTGLTGVDPSDVAAAEEMVALYGHQMLAWHRDEKLGLKRIAQRLTRKRPAGDWRPEGGPSWAVIRLAYRQMGVVLAGVPSTRAPAQDRVFAQWELVQDMRSRGVGQKKIAELVGVSIDSLRCALKAVADGNIDPVAMRETAGAVAA